MTMKTPTPLLLILALVAAACAAEPGATADVSPAASLITGAAIAADVAVLSADSMEGRAPATVGEERAIRYIVERYREIGLEPVDEDYLLPVELVGLTRDEEASSLRIEGPGGALPLADGENVTYWSTTEEPVVDLRDAPLIFVGYGVQAPEHDWDDFKAQDMSGKVLLFLNSDPPVEEGGEALFGGDARTYYGRWSYKYEQADKLGAAGAIVIHTTESASYGFSVIGNMGSGQVWQRTYQVPMLAWVDSTTSERVAAAMNTDLAGLFEMAARRDFRPVDTGYRVDAHIETAIERVRADNVAGVVRGSDPDLADEYVVFTAHHDHMGIDEGVAGADKIYNGALDNALGVSAMMAAAEAFVAAAPRRSVMFLSVTAEEGGLLGSSAFVADPPVPLDRIVANFNVDSPQAFGETRDVAAIGIDMNTLGQSFAAVAEERGLVPMGDPNPNAGSFYRSDQVNFAKAGIPALYLQAGTDYVRDLGFDAAAYKLERYHQVTDEVTDAWDFRGVERDMRVLFETALRVANADERPRWVAGHEFEEEWKELYGRD